VAPSVNSGLEFSPEQRLNVVACERIERLLQALPQGRNRVITGQGA
jgi:hypothetical protein